MSRPALALTSCAVLLASCGPSLPPPGGPGRVRTGLDVLEDSGFKELQGKRVGLITNQTGRDSRGRPAAEVLADAPGVTLAAVFSPEHGFKGTSEASSVGSDALVLGGRDLPLYSLYGGGIAGMRPRPEQLEGLDALVFDIQDVGARFYTYLATMAMALEEAKKAKVEFVVLDRPNPVNGLAVEGPVLADKNLRLLTPVAYFQVPTRHGLTAGEMALLHNAEVRHPRLTVVPMAGWSRRMWYDDTGLPWTPPSPNMPDLESATLYPGIANLEFSNVSVGRGTPAPFRWVGAPWLKADEVVRRLEAAFLDGVSFSARDFTPTKDPYAGRPCHGVFMRVTDREAASPFKVFVHLAAALRDLHPREYEPTWERTVLLVGSHEFKRLYEAGAAPREILQFFERQPREFEERRRKFLLYE